ncbi:phage holin family protein [Microvirga brassicacearum]|uniref:Phage holin family protein n=1 Tax=Microvirga brassicacearum TaxID=2580413 RepID=A0A5N3PD32_9HYPH|nr:phage holin family protein [Microvirga brassicacearum]KAB0267646.1 phage holin family protein [Microvirga brassicacearum]
MSGQVNQTIKTLLGEALRESGDLAQKEFTLFRTEMTQNVRRMFLGLGMMVAAAVFAIAALMLFTEALVDWLATLLDSRALSALIVGGVMAVIAVGLVLYGRHAISAASLVPNRAVRSVKRDAEVLSERVAG